MGTRHSKQERGRQDHAGGVDGVRGGTNKIELIVPVRSTIFCNEHTRPHIYDIPIGCWAEMIERTMSGNEFWRIVRPNRG